MHSTTYEVQRIEFRCWQSLRPGAEWPAHRPGTGCSTPRRSPAWSLVATLRGPGIGLEAVRAVLDEHQTPADVASIHARALEDEIAGPRLRRAVLAAVTRRKPDKEEMRTMHDLARLTAAERERLVDAFVTDTFGGRDTSAIGEHMRRATPALPDDPTSEQIDAWIEVAESSLRTKASAGGGARWPRPANSRRRTRVRTAVPSSRPPSASTPAPRWPRGSTLHRTRRRPSSPASCPAADALERGRAGRQAARVHGRVRGALLAAGRCDQRMAAVPACHAGVPLVHRRARSPARGSGFLSSRHRQAPGLKSDFGSCGGPPAPAAWRRREAGSRGAP